MKTNFLRLSVLALVVLFSSCSDDDKKADPLAAKTYSNLYAPQTGGQGQPVSGEFTKFSFSEGKVVTGDMWDIAFRGTTILVNGGNKIGNITDEPAKTGNGAVSIQTGTFASITAIPAASTFLQDGQATYAFPTSGVNCWFDYNSTSHIISPKAGKVFVVKTHDGKYAKFEILSYYQDAPALPTATSISRYYKFNYIYQPNSNTGF